MKKNLTLIRMECLIDEADNAGDYEESTNLLTESIACGIYYLVQNSREKR